MFGLPQATVDMQILGDCEPDCNICRQVSSSACTWPWYCQASMPLSNQYRVGAARNTGRSRKQSRKPTLGNESQPQPLGLPIQVVDLSYSRCAEEQRGARTPVRPTTSHLTPISGSCSGTTYAWEDAVSQCFAVVVRLFAILALQYTLFEPHASTFLRPWLRTSLRELLD